MRKVRALVVEDNHTEFNTLQKALKYAEVDLQIVRAEPATADEDLGALLETVLAEHLDRIDLAFVDLELAAGIASARDFEPEMLRGGSEVLPWLRSHAPWVPVIGWSRLLREDQPGSHMAAYAASFGFDAFLPKGLTTMGGRERRFPQEWGTVVWDWLHQTALASRVRSQTLASGFSDRPWYDSAIEIDVPLTDGASLDEMFPAKGLAERPAWRVLLAWMFGPVASKVSVTPLVPGASGAAVIDVVCEHPGEEVPGRWVVKLSSSPTKLHKEAVAHAGLSRTSTLLKHAVPLFGNGIVAVDGTAALGYAFAAGNSAAEVTKSADASRLLRCLDGLHVRRRSNEVSSVDQLFEAAQGIESLRVIATEDIGGLPASLSEFLEGGAPKVLKRRITYTSVIAHGDLHLDNILLGQDHDIVIDWPFRAQAPLSRDVAKLLTDAARRMPEFGRSPPPLTGRSWAWFSPVLSKMMLTEDDFVMLRAFSITNYIRMLRYRELSEQQRADLRQWLTSGLPADWLLNGD